MLCDHFNQVLSGLQGETTLAFLKDRGRAADRLTYTELGRLVAVNAAYFLDSGIHPGDKVAICLATTIEHVVSFLALMAAGAIPVSVKPSAGGDHQAYAQYLSRVVAQSNVAYALHDLPTVDIPKIRWVTAITPARSLHRAEPGSPDDIAFIQFSSGSTAAPKPIAISHGNLMSNIADIHAMDGRSGGSVGFNFLPLNHDMGLVGGLLSNLPVCNSLFLAATDDFIRSPIPYLTRMDVEGADVTAMPNFALRMVTAWMGRRHAERPDLLRAWRTIYCGAETISKQTVDSFVAVGEMAGLNPGALVFSYGLAEASLFVTGHRYAGNSRDFTRSASGRLVANVGAPSPGTEVSVKGRSGSEVLVRGPGISRMAVGAEGWLHTGDVGFIENGDLHITGRIKELIAINGRNIHMQDIEELVYSYVTVRECVALPDDNEQYILAVVEQSGTSFPEEDVSSMLARQLGCAPAGVIVCKASDILRTTSGKPIRHRILRGVKDQHLNRRD